MKFTCLSEGKGYYFPPCHTLDICGFRILIDCPLDLSSLSIFSPVPTQWIAVIDEDTSCACHTSLGLESTENKRPNLKKPLVGSGLIHAEPWYKAVKSLKLCDPSFIDIVLISSPMGMLGLPFLTRKKDFCAKHIYATEAAMRLGQLIMEDLITMHKEFAQFYGPEGSTGPQWMKWDEIESLPSAVKERFLGQDGRELSSWLPLYSAADLKECMQKIQSLKYAEEACYNGTLIIQPFSSGLDVGTSNWRIISLKRIISYLSSSISSSAVAFSFDHKALQGSDVILFSDFTASNYLDKYESDKNGSTLDKYLSNLSDTNKNGGTVEEFLPNADDEPLEELEKLSFVCSCSLDCVKAGGSVLIPIGRVEIMLQLLEQIVISLESSNVKVPILIVSSIVEELLAFFNAMPEWLCQQRQDKLYYGQPPFSYMELLQEKRLCVYPVIHSPKLLTHWQEPCIVFCPHWSLRMGPAVHLLRRWGHDANSLLIVEEAVNMDFIFLPFKPMAMKVIQCSFLSGMKWQKAEILLKFLKPERVLLPEKLRRDGCSIDQFTISYYSQNETLHVPNLKDGSEVDTEIDLACRLRYTKLVQEDMNIARVKGELFREHGKTRLLVDNEEVLSSQARPVVCLGRLNLEILVNTLQKFGMNTRVEEVASADGSGKASFVHVLEPKEATIEIRATSTVISTPDESLASTISEAISSTLDSI